MASQRLITWVDLAASSPMVSCRFPNCDRVLAGDEPCHSSRTATPSRGVGDYREPILHAPITAEDARGIAGALKDPAVGAYPPERVYQLQDAKATRDGVLVAPDQLALL